MTRFAIIIFIFFNSLSSVFSQTTDSLIVHKDTIRKFQFKYPNNYILYDGCLLRNKTDDSTHWRIRIDCQRFDSFYGQETYKDFVKRVSSNVFDADGPGIASFHGESIDSIVYLKNKLGINIIEIYENVSYLDMTVKPNIKSTSIQGPVFFVDLSEVNKDYGVVFCLADIDMITTNNNLESERVLRKIIDSFDFIKQ